MLVLSRRVGESVIMGDSEDSNVKVLGFRGNEVILGFSLPTSITVRRDELHRKIKQSEKAKDSTSHH